MTELEKIAPVNIFKVPENYFEGLPSAIQQRMEEPSLGLEKKRSFSTPKGYFEGLSAKILSRIDQIETKKIDLETLARVNIFNVPSDYFEILSEATLSKIYKPKVIQVNWFNKNKVRWSAAAGVVLMVGMWFATPQFGKDTTAQTLEKVSNEEIKNYLETQDLSYLEYESAVENVKNSAKLIDSKVLEGLQIDKQEILEHLENQDLEEAI